MGIKENAKQRKVTIRRKLPVFLSVTKHARRKGISFVSLRRVYCKPSLTIEDKFQAIIRKSTVYKRLFGSNLCFQRPKKTHIISKGFGWILCTVFHHDISVVE